MKKLALTVGVAALLATVTNGQTTNALTKIGDAFKALGSSTNWGFVGYGTMGEAKTIILNAQKKTSRAYGGGIIGIYNLNDFVGLGGGIDELMGLDSKGQTTIINATVQAQLPLQPLSLFWTNSFATSFTVTPFLYSSMGTPLGSTINSSVITHEGEGINVDLFKTGSWVIGGGFALIERQNADVYSGKYKNFFIDVHHPF